jgi:hypothetical protein
LPFVLHIFKAGMQVEVYYYKEIQIDIKKWTLSRPLHSFCSKFMHLVVAFHFERPEPQ